MPMFFAIMIDLTIVTLFLGETTDTEMFRLATVLFLAVVRFFLLALLCFLTETLIATHMLNFGRNTRRIS